MDVTTQTLNAHETSKSKCIDIQFANSLFIQIIDRMPYNLYVIYYPNVLGNVEIKRIYLTLNCSTFENRQVKLIG